jgi:hypothetical protein
VPPFAKEGTSVGDNSVRLGGHDPVSQLNIFGPFCMQNRVQKGAKIIRVQPRVAIDCRHDTGFVASGDILMLTTRSDETIIYWFFEAYLESDWLKAITEDLAEQSKPMTYEPPAKRMKWQGCQYASRTLVHSYYQWRQKIAEMRRDKSDEALS